MEYLIRILVGVTDIFKIMFLKLGLVMLVTVENYYKKQFNFTFVSMGFNTAYQSLNSPVHLLDR